ncbi:TolC family outer membrane protein [Acetobacter thailandicus]|uniref:TolC family outer membrane protein n=1 Tax=Acetobacter thailandicus TaxID=1502842 RepID=UPI001BA4B862|nr:TolC family outer membrane protein [Acetobacter thailandicus]MBS0961378.1 TolC family outer membrane protein [Acetobacter thailandicus]
MMQKTYIIFTCFLFVPCIVQAQTLREALTLAYRNNPSFLGEQANLRAQSENSAQARSGWRPAVSVTMDANYQKGPDSSNFRGGSYSTNYAQGYVTARQTLYSFGHVANQVRASDARSRAAGHGVRLTEAQIFTSVTTAYMDVLRDRYILDVRKADLAMLQKQVSLISTRYQLGGAAAEQVTRTDVEQAQTRQHSASVACAQARTNLAASEARFQALTGVYAGELTMPESLPGLPQNLRQAEHETLARSPELEQMREMKIAAAADIDTARSQWGPQVVVQGQYGTIGPASSFKGHAYKQQVNGVVSLVQPIYNGDLYNSQIRQARDKNEQASQNVELARRTALQTINTQWYAVENGREAVRAALKEVQSGELTLRGYQLEYNYGKRSTTDVLYADQNLRAAQIDLATSRHDIVVAEASLLAAMGRLQAKYLQLNTAYYDTHAVIHRAQTRGWELLQTPISMLDKVGW